MDTVVLDVSIIVKKVSSCLLIHQNSRLTSQIILKVHRSLRIWCVYFKAGRTVCLFFLKHYMFSCLGLEDEEMPTMS